MSFTCEWQSTRIIINKPPHLDHPVTTQRFFLFVAPPCPPNTSLISLFIHNIQNLQNCITAIIHIELPSSLQSIKPLMMMIGRLLICLYLCMCSLCLLRACWIANQKPNRLIPNCHKFESPSPRNVKSTGCWVLRPQWQRSRKPRWSVRWRWRAGGSWYTMYIIICLEIIKIISPTATTNTYISNNPTPKTEISMATRRWFTATTFVLQRIRYRRPRPTLPRRTTSVNKCSDHIHLLLCTCLRVYIGVPTLTTILLLPHNSL